MHRAAPARDRAHFIVRRLLKTLHAQIAVYFTERSFDHAFAGQERAFDDDFGVSGHEQSFAPGFRRRQPQRLLQVAADDFIFADFERPTVASAHLIGRMMTDHRGDRTFFIGFFVAAKDPPHMLQASSGSRYGFDL